MPAKDTTTTVVGGALGLEQLYETLDILGQTGPSWQVLAEGLKAVALMVLGYLAYKGQKHVAPVGQ